MIYVGIDHSLTAFGIVAVDASWELDFARVRRKTWETSSSHPAPHRRAWLAARVVEFVRGLHVSVPDIRVATEGGIFNSAGRADSVRSQERLAGVVEHELWKLGIELQIAQQQAVRNVFLGRSAAFGRGAGATAQAMLGEAAPATRSWFEAELDAFLVANYMLAESGEAFISCAPAVEPGKKTKLARAARAKTGSSDHGPVTRNWNAEKHFLSCSTCDATSTFDATDTELEPKSKAFIAVHERCGSKSEAPEEGEEAAE